MGQRSKSKLESLREVWEESKEVIHCMKLLLTQFKHEIVTKSVENEFGCKAGQHWRKLFRVPTVCVAT